MLSRSALLEKMKNYDPRAQLDLVGRAYDYAQEKHEGQMRSSGDPYFSHPVAVAEILAGMHLDSASIATALLHDTVEDTSASIEDIQKKFGDEVAQLVDQTVQNQAANGGHATGGKFPQAGFGHVRGYPDFDDQVGGSVAQYANPQLFAQTGKAGAYCP